MDKNKILDKWYEVDPNSYLEYWEPDIEGEVMLAKLFKQDPSFFSLITGTEHLSELSELSGIPIKKLLQKDIKSRPYSLICSNPKCKAILGYTDPNSINRLCPVCGAGTLTKIKSKNIPQELLDRLPY